MEENNNLLNTEEQQVSSELEEKKSPVLRTLPQRRSKHRTNKHFDTAYRKKRKHKLKAVKISRKLNRKK